MPTTSSTVYSGPITVSATETVKALAAESGYTNSAVASATYTLTVATPAFSPGTGNYPSAQTVAIGDTTSGVTIYYTTDGTMPTTGSAVYSSPITVAANESVRALAVKSGYTNSVVGSAAYIIGIGGNLVTDSFSGSGPLSSNWTNMSTEAQSGLSFSSRPAAAVRRDGGLPLLPSHRIRGDGSSTRESHSARASIPRSIRGPFGGRRHGSMRSHERGRQCLLLRSG